MNSIAENGCNLQLLLITLNYFCHKLFCIRESVVISIILFHDNFRSGDYGYIFLFAPGFNFELKVAQKSFHPTSSK